MKISRLFKKLIFHSEKSVIGLIAYVDSRWYMRSYNSLLKRSGFKLNGVPRFIAKSARFDDFNRITLGDRLVVSMNVHFLTHDYSYTTALVSIGQPPETDICILRNITIGNNVFIGMNSIILPGSEVGNHVIIGAGSVVRGRIEDFSIVAGNPAVVIGDVRGYAEKVKGRTNQDANTDKH